VECHFGRHRVVTKLEGLGRASRGGGGGGAAPSPSRAARKGNTRFIGNGDNDVPKRSGGPSASVVQDTIQRPPTLPPKFGSGQLTAAGRNRGDSR